MLVPVSSSGRQGRPPAVGAGCGQGPSLDSSCSPIQQVFSECPPPRAGTAVGAGGRFSPHRLNGYMDKQHGIAYFLKNSVVLRYSFVVHSFIRQVFPGTCILGTVNTAQSETDENPP